jgi:cytochrome c553
VRIRVAVSLRMTVVGMAGLLCAAGATQAAPADAQAGATKAAACAACHGAQGVATQALTPSLAAQPALSTVYQLIQFRDKRRLSPTKTVLAEGLSDQDMKDLAAYFAALPPPPAVPSSDTQKLADGQRVAQAQFCTSCHAEGLKGQKHIARLAGQQADYLRVQMQNLKSGARADIDGTMASAAQGLSAADIDALAAYAASLGP